MIKVALLTWDYHPVKSGLARAAVEIAEGLAEAGAEVTVFSLDRSDCADIGAVRVVGASPGPVLARLRRYPAIGHLAAPLAFSRALARHGPFDVVETTNWYAPGLFAPRLVTRHSTPASVSAEAGALRDRIDHASVRLLERLAARRSRGHISNMRHHAASMATLYGITPLGARHVTIGLPVSDAMHHFARRAEPASTDGPPRLLFVGRGTRRKGFDLLAAALDALANGLAPDFAIDLVGCGEADLARLSSAVRARVTLASRPSDQDLACLYASAAVVVAPSRYESFGLVYREALLFGIPVVALNSDPSAAEFFGDTPGGILIEPDADALAHALARLIRDKGVRAAARTEARRAGAALKPSRLAFGQATLEAYARFNLIDRAHSAAARVAG